VIPHHSDRLRDCSALSSIAATPLAERGDLCAVHVSLESFVLVTDCVSIATDCVSIASLHHCIMVFHCDRCFIGDDC
jgi:hypothetical protein